MALRRQDAETQTLRGLKQTLIVEYIFMLMLDQNIIHFLLRCTQLVLFSPHFTPIYFSLSTLLHPAGHCIRLRNSPQKPPLNPCIVVPGLCAP